MSATNKSRGFLPDYCFGRVTDIQPGWLLGLGLRGVLLDIDNTITRWEQRTVPEAEMNWLATLTAAGLQLRLLSNGLAVKRAAVERQTSIPHVAGANLKPLVWAFRCGLRELGLRCEQVIMIGDGVITDIWGANRAGIWSCLVEPLSPVDFPGSKIHRQLEHLFRLRHPLQPQGDFRGRIDPAG